VIDGLFSGTQYQTAKKLLDAAALRHAALASNIANAETPGYKRVDLDKSFEAELKNAVKGKDTTQALSQVTPRLSEDANAAAVRPDGNNVSIDKELMEANRNTVEYQFLTQYLSSNIQSIRAAIQTSNN
jgi:flagellar basal-body rod protein FlgB